MSNAKVIEMIKQCEMTDYMHKLADVKMEKLILFNTFPITHAPNLAAPRYFVLIKNIERLIDIKKPDLN